MYRKLLSEILYTITWKQNLFNSNGITSNRHIEASTVNPQELCSLNSALNAGASQVFSKSSSNVVVPTEAKTKTKQSKALFNYWCEKPGKLVPNLPRQHGFPQEAWLIMKQIWDIKGFLSWFLATRSFVLKSIWLCPAQLKTRGFLFWEGIFHVGFSFRNVSLGLLSLGRLPLVAMVTGEARICFLLSRLEWIINSPPPTPLISIPFKRHKWSNSFLFFVLRSSLD